MKPLLIVVSAPSGAGKSTLCDMLLAEYDNIRYSVSCTTRAPRGKERDGIDYIFLSMSDFKSKVDNGDFLEHAQVHGNLYGTLVETVTDALNSGLSIIMDIDVQGADQVRKYLDTLPADSAVKRSYLDIFIKPPSLETLQQRLLARGEDSDDVVAARMKAASSEIDCAGKYKYVIVNDDLQTAYSELTEIVRKEAMS